MKKNNLTKKQLDRYDDSIAIIVLLLVAVVVLALIYVIYNVYTLNIKFSFPEPVKDPGQIGDIVGGVSSPFISLIAALLTFIAFWTQYSFNKVQNIKIDQQRDDQERIRIEGLIYEKIRIHRENVSEISIKNISNGRRAFISMFKEFKFCYHVLNEVYFNYKRRNKNFSLTSNQLVEISFITFFFGIGESSDRVTSSLLVNYDEEFRNEFYISLKLFQQDWEGKVKVYDSENSKAEFNKYIDPVQINVLTQDGQPTGRLFQLTIGYKPFGGHLVRLGHYFRHLYQTVEYIDRQDEKIINKKLKYEYIKTLRAQISAHEQLLLYYNSLTVMGRTWWLKSYIKKFKMVKNIPLPLADIEPLPTSKLEAKYFEWNEITNSIS